MAERAGRLGIPMPAAATAACRTARPQGHGPEDKGGMVCVYEELPETGFHGEGG